MAAEGVSASTVMVRLRVWLTSPRRVVVSRRVSTPKVTLASLWGNGIWQTSTDSSSIFTFW